MPSCFRFEGREADLNGGMDLVGSVSASCSGNTEGTLLKVK